MPDDALRGATQRSAAHGQPVDAFIEALEHPLKPEIRALRALILAADPSIGEAIKWNAPSFHTTEHFATFHLCARDGLRVVLHRGARKRSEADVLPTIDDPERLLTWLAPDRATLTFRNSNEIDAHRAAFTQIIRQWIQFVA